MNRKERKQFIKEQRKSMKVFKEMCAIWDRKPSEVISSLHKQFREWESG